MNYIVLGGGNSPESEVSKRSARAVQSALEQLGHSVTYLDPADLSLDEVLDRATKSDGVFPILHGVGGEDGILQSAFEKNDIPFFGSAAKACRTTFNKDVFKQILQENNLPTPVWKVISAEEFADEPLTKSAFVLKPLDGGSSIDTFIVRTLPFDDAPLIEALNRHGRMLIETLIEGDEVTVGILDDKALPLIEIIPPENEEFDYENKYNGKTRELCPPENISHELQEKAQGLALAAHKTMGCRHISRTDILINKKGELFIIDTNIMPGLTDQSLYPKSAAHEGYSWTDLVDVFTKLI